MNDWKSTKKICSINTEFDLILVIIMKSVFDIEEELKIEQRLSRYVLLETIAGKHNTNLKHF